MAKLIDDILHALAEHLPPLADEPGGLERVPEARRDLIRDAGRFVARWPSANPPQDVTDAMFVVGQPWGDPAITRLSEMLVAWLMQPAAGSPDERRRRQATAAELQAAINRAELSEEASARTLLAEALKSWNLELPDAAPATPAREVWVVLDVFGRPTTAEWAGAKASGAREIIYHSEHRDRPEPIDPRSDLDWAALADATEATVAQLRERLAGSEPTRLTIAGLAPLPLFAHLGMTLSAWSQPAVLLNRRGTGEWDALQIDGQPAGAPFFDLVRGLDRTDPAEEIGRVAVFVAPAGYLISLSAIRAYLAERGERLAGLVEITSSQETLTAETANAASADLLQAMRAIRAAYPRAHGIALFVAGPSTLAFLAGRALNPNVLGTIDVPQFQAGRYVPALMLPWLGGRAAAPSPEASLSLDRLRLRDFRGIRDAEIELHPESSVLIGLNGAGKTSVLDAMSLMLAQLIDPIVARATERQGDKPPTRQRLAFDDIRIGADEATIEAVIRWDERRSQWSIQRRRDENSPAVHKASPALKQAIDALDRLSGTEDAGLPIAVYYSVNRADPDIPQRTRSTATSRARRIYGDALLKGQADFRAFFSWFKDCEDDENAARRSNAIYEDPRLAAVRRAIEKMLDGFRRPRIERKPLRMVIDKQATTLSISQLSDGERSLIALAGDLARRLCEANPRLRDPLGGAGVVLIDELELHLHAGWQRKVLPRLRQTFPRCQFIVSTHSPQVLSEVRDGAVFGLRTTAEGVTLQRLETPYGFDSNQILVEWLDVSERPERVDAAFAEIYEFIDRGLIDEAEAKRDALLEEVAATYPEFSRVDMRLYSRRWGLP